MSEPEVTQETRKAFIREIISNPKKYKEKWDAEIRAKNPDMTEEQIQKSWAQLANQFDLGLQDWFERGL